MITKIPQDQYQNYEQFGPGTILRAQYDPTGTHPLLADNGAQMFYGLRPGATPLFQGDPSWDRTYNTALAGLAGIGIAGGAAVGAGAGAGETGASLPASTGLPTATAPAVAAGTNALEAGSTGAQSGIPPVTDTSTDYNWLNGIPGVLGAVGAHNQTQAYDRLAQQYMFMGQPYRDRLAALYADPNAFLTSPEVTTPVQQGTNAMARALSVQGNPIGSGHALQELQDYSSNQLFSRLGEEKNRLAGFGGLASYNAAAPSQANAAIGSQGNMFNAIGAGVGAVVNPQPSLVDLYRSMRGLA